MRKKTTKVDIIIIAVIILLIAGVILLAMLPPNAPDPENTVSADTDGDGSITYKDYIGKRIGIMTGSSFEAITFKYFPDSEYVYLESASDLAVALENNKIDAFLQDEPVLRMIHSENSNLDYIRQPLIDDDYSFIFQKNSEKCDKLLQQFNDLLKDLKESGRLDDITEKWFGTDDSAKTFDRTPSSGENGAIIVAGTSDHVPFTYYLNNEYTGFAVDLITIFSQEYGYSIEFEQPNLTALVAGVTSGKYDIGIGSISVTEERKESVNFSDTVYNGGVVLMVRASDIDGTGSERELVPEITFDKLNSPDCKVGVGTGASGMLAVEEYLPNAKELMFDSLATAFEAVRAEQLDAFVFERRQLQIALDNGMQGVMLLDENLGESIDVAVGLSRATKISGLQDSINRFIAEKTADGTLDDMYKRWVVDKNYNMPDIEPAASPKFTLVVGTSGLVEPYSFYEGTTLTGFDIEMSRRFAVWLGADIEYKVIDYSGIIAAAQSGSIDCIFANLNVTDERKEAIDFSDPIYSIENGILVRAVSTNETVSKQSWLDSIASSFEKNFIREDRWQMILDGIGTTCFITVMSAIFGSILAFLICMFRRTGSRLANAISNIYVKLLQGTPIVVLLMILYYVLLGKSGLEAVWVAVIGFSLNFGAYASEIMRSGIESIDGGQREAALALGFNENQAFFRFIFPQAAVRFVPVYKQEIVSLLKSTSIVGYIAIQDLTKMSDIIRSRTYEAFFPLIATAIIYFILAWVIALILKIVLKAFDKRHSAVCGKK
ncbi:MAG: ABC transporter permease subunit [Ruminiclostridium sp.]|nr:ABC transporter permease subunit [Ruminiclostridium sp.]